MRVLVLIACLTACRRDAERSIAPDPPATTQPSVAPAVAADVEVVVDVARLEAFGVLRSQVVSELDASGYKVVEMRDDPAAHALRLGVATKTRDLTAILKVVVATRAGAPVRISDIAEVRTK